MVVMVVLVLLLLLLATVTIAFPLQELFCLCCIHLLRGINRCDHFCTFVCSTLCKSIGKIVQLDCVVDSQQTPLPLVFHICLLAVNCVLADVMFALVLCRQ